MECQINDLTIHYEMHGDSDGIPLVMLHGWRADHRHIMADIEPLFQQRSGWQRIYFDLPGMGHSSGVDWIDSHDAMLEAILAFLDQLLPKQRFVLGGVSWGGYLARGVVYRWPERIAGLLLLVPMIKKFSKQIRPQPITLVEDPQLLAEMSPEEIEILRSFAVVQNSDWLEWVRQLVAPAFALTNQALASRLEQKDIFSFNPDELPAPILAPTLILTARQDAHCGYQDAWTIIENYPRATFALLDRAGHIPTLEQKRLFRTLADEWLGRVEEYVKGDASSISGKF